MEEIIGIGLDVIDASKRKATRALAERVLSEDELARYDAFPSKVAAFDFLFGRWAAKEAFFKATGRADAFSTIVIGNEKDGKPVLLRPADCKTLISISHDKRMFAAVVIAFR